VTRFTTQVAMLVIFEGAIQGCQLTQLNPLMLIPGFISWHQQILDHLSCSINLHSKNVCHETAWLKCLAHWSQKVMLRMF